MTNPVDSDTTVRGEDVNLEGGKGEEAEESGCPNGENLPIHRKRQYEPSSKRCGGSHLLESVLALWRGCCW